MNNRSYPTLSLRAKRSNLREQPRLARGDCFVAALLAMTVVLASCSSGQTGGGANADASADYVAPTGATSTSGSTPLTPAVVIESSGAGSDGAPILGTVGAVALDSDGNIYVADYQQSVVHVYDSSGTFLRSIGSRGEGPGEFQIPVAVSVRGDTVYVYDNRLYRSSAFRRSDGSFVRSFSLKIDEWLPRTVIGYTDESAVAIYSPPVAFDDPDPEIQNEEIRLVDLSGNGARTIWTTPGTDWKRIELSGMTMMRNMPLSFNSSCTVKDDVGYCAYSSAVRVNAFTLDGDSIDVANVPAPRRKVTAAERAAILDPIPNPALRDALIVPDEHPAFAGPVVVDDAGRVWIRRWASDEEGTEYWVIDRDEHSVEAVTFDGRMILYGAGGGRVVGVSDGNVQIHVIASEAIP